MIYSIDCGWAGDCQALLSYPLNVSLEISEALPDSLQEMGFFGSIVSQGLASVYADGEWQGSLDYFDPGRGYWFGISQSGDFSYVNNVLARETAQLAKIVQKRDMYPENFEYTKYIQSTQQAFYFVGELELQSTEITYEDWLLSYCGDQVVGARQYFGKYTDIPAMGVCNDEETTGYCQEGEVPRLKLLKPDGREIDLGGDIPPFINNGVNLLSMLSEQTLLPGEYNLDRAYPNPFNPITTINFAIPQESDISITIYNLQGREVASLINGIKVAGYHSIVWDAHSFSSGVYFVKMVGGDYVHTQKLMLVK